MDRYIASSDGIMIHYKVSGNGDTAVVFVHGWLGNGHWWDSQTEYFSNIYRVVTIDLAGHGESGKGRQDWSGKSYADDIEAVIGQIDSESVVLVGHSMSGAYVLEAALELTNVKAIVLVDTLKDLDQLMTYQQADDMILSLYRKDFQGTVVNLLPKFLFCESTPEPVQRRLIEEFLASDPEFAVKAIEPLYKMDIRELARQTKIPVRAINSSFTPTNIESNRRYFGDFDYLSISGTGHYPMLEKPVEFNELLKKLLSDIAG